MKGKITVFSRSALFESESWIGTGHICLRKDMLSAVDVAKIRDRAEKLNPIQEMKDETIKTMFKKADLSNPCPVIVLGDKETFRAVYCAGYVNWFNLDYLAWFDGQEIGSTGDRAALVAYDGTGGICGLLMPVSPNADCDMIGAAIIADYAEMNRVQTA